MYVFVWLLAMSLTCLAQPLSAVDERYIDSLMQGYYETDGPGAALLVAKGGEVLYRKAFGQANLELGVPHTPESVFRVGSITKQFTALCVLQLAEAGKLKLSDDIRAYLPDYDTHGRDITIQHILTHTSGITSYTEKADFGEKLIQYYSKEDLVDYFMGDSLLFEPGTDWSYCNSGYVLAGVIVEKLSGQTLGEYMQKHIFDPLDMKDTHIGTYSRVIPRAVNGYVGAGNGTFRPAPYLDWSWPYAAGDILSTVDDMLKWDQALYTDQLVSQAWLAKAWDPMLLANGRSTSYGFGWVNNTFEGMEIISHGGGINGFVAYALRIPSQQLYVVALTNTTTANPSVYVPEIALRLSKHPVSTPTYGAMDAKAMEEYTGVFEVHRLGTRIATNTTDERVFRYIFLEGDTLTMQQSGGGKQILWPTDKDLFSIDGSANYVRFHRGEEGAVAALELYSQPLQYGPTEYELKTDVPLPAAKEALELAPELIKKYAGTYDFNRGFKIVVTTEGSHLYITPSGQPTEEVFAESETKFFATSVDATIEFKRSETGEVEGMTLTQGSKYEAKKIE